MFWNCWKRFGQGFGLSCQFSADFYFFVFSVCVTRKVILCFINWVTTQLSSISFFIRRFQVFLFGILNFVADSYYFIFCVCCKIGHTATNKWSWCYPLASIYFSFIRTHCVTIKFELYLESVVRFNHLKYWCIFIFILLMNMMCRIFDCQRKQQTLL